MSQRWSLKDIPPHLLQRPTQARFAPEPKPRKYRNQPVVVDGKRFDSKLELHCYNWLCARRTARDVLWFIRQVPFELPGGIKYRADFLAVTKSGVEVIDAKGVETRVSANKRKQVMELYGVPVQIWGKREAARWARSA